MWRIHRGPVNSPHKWPVTRKMFPFDDVIMPRGFAIKVCVYVTIPDYCYFTMHRIKACSDVTLSQLSSVLWPLTAEMLILVNRSRTYKLAIASDRNGPQFQQLPYRLEYGACRPTSIAGGTILVPYHEVTSPQLIWRSAMPDLQIICSELT